MRHGVDHRKLGVKSAHRKAMLANLASSLIINDRIETTLPKAKELRRFAERLVTMGKQGSLHARRRALSFIRNKPAVQKLFDDLAKRFADRHGGYTRILKLGSRHGDASPMAAIEYLHAFTRGPEGETKTQKKGAEGKRTAREEKERKTAAKTIKSAEKKKLFSRTKTSPDVKKPAKRSSPAHRSSKGE